MIRPFQNSDKETLISIFKQNVPKYFDPTELADFESHLESHTSTYYTALHDKEIAGGFGFAIKANKIGSITWIFFNPDHTGNGIGTKAVQFCHKQMSELGVKKFSVRTSQHAYQFFEKFGYTTTYIEKNYWGEGLDLYEMKRMKG